MPPVRHRAAQRAGRPGDHAGRRRRDGRADRRQHDRDHGLGLQLRLRHHRPDRRAVGPRARARRRPARRRLPRRVHPAVRPGARLRHPGLRLPRPRRHLDLGRHPQVRLRVQGHLGAAVPRQGAAQQPVLLPDRLDRRQVLSPGIEGSRSGGLLAGTWASMVRSAARATASYAKEIFETAVAMQDAVRSHPELRIMGDPDVLLQLHQRRVRHLPRQRLHAARRAGASTASSTRTRSTWPSPARRPSRGRGPVRRRPRRGGRVREGEARGRRGRLRRRDLRRRRRRHRPATDEFIGAVMADMLDKQQALPPA